MDWLDALKPIAKAAALLFAVTFVVVGYNQLNDEGYFVALRSMSAPFMRDSMRR